MNRLEDSPLFQSINTLIDRLTEIWGSGKEEPSVGEILSAARAIEQIGKEGEGFLAEMQELLGNSAVYEELAEIVAQCQEESPASLPVRELIARLGGWRDGFREMLEEREAARARREAQPTCQELQQNLKQLQTDVRNSQQLQDSLKLELIGNLLDLAERLQPEADLQLLAAELERLRARFSSALRQPAAPPPQQPPLTSTAGASTEVTPDSLLDRLRQIQPKESNSIPEVQKIQKQVTSEANHEVLVNTINLLEAEKLLSATWLKAMFVSSYLEVARGGSESLSGVLNSLESNSQKWLAGNWDVQAVVIRVCQSLEEFSSSYPSLLSLEKIYAFFSRLQEEMGDSPHFRIEIILARLSLELARFNSPALEYLQKALSHAERALNLKPNLAEAILLKQQAEFLANLEKLWGENENYQLEGGIMKTEPRKTIEETIREPAIGRLEKVYSQLKTANKPWCAFAFFDVLSKQNPDNLAVRWYRARSTQEPEGKSDYFQTALLFLNSKDAGVTAATIATVASQLLSLKLYGLALAVAKLESDSAAAGINITVNSAAQKCRLQPWEWPLALQKARQKFQMCKGEGNWDNWIEAADGIVQALLAAPTHWATCMAFFDIFTRPSDDGEEWGKTAIDLALAIVRYLNQDRQFPEQPELLVLEAELRYSAGKLESRFLPDAVRNKCEELCRRAHPDRGAFAPAIRLQERLAPKLVTLASGETFVNRYRIVSPMRTGSFGQVYRAEVTDEKWSGPKSVALKLVRTDAATSEKLQHFTRLLEQEAKIAVRLDHPHIVKTCDFIKEHKCLVMEFINGETVGDKLDNKITLPWKSAAEIGRQIAEALSYAGKVVERDFDKSDFAHRDIHPGNIMVMGTTENPDAKLLDFGLARIPGGPTSTVALEGVDRRMIYRAPEYGNKMDLRADMFALGVILYELLAGEFPYPVDKYSEYKHDICSGSEVAQSLRPLRDILADTDAPAQLESVLLKMVAFNKNDRYQSWKELIAELEQLLAS
ncbi:serine/threonine-protein kinase [Kamptonema formosum]|uniref:serine/threonine-protein kinase n=1 Tax=Kamptonema formosum TaxID=331992 RepID=UPI0003463FD9|nr:serine/threonine-protein kinase [Oscillatoria sp. PCC 10802]